MAPEQLIGKSNPIRPAIDIWATGIILYSLVCGTLPFRADKWKEMIKKIFIGLEFPSKIEKHLSAEVKDLITKMLCIEREERYNISEIMEHPWYTNKKLIQFFSSYLINFLIFYLETIKLKK